MASDALPYLLFTAGATPCALPCARVARVTAIDEDAPSGWLDPESLGLGATAPDEATRLLWLTPPRAAQPLPIVGNCRLTVVPAADVLPLPSLHRRLTPFCALLNSTEGPALLLEPDALDSQLLRPA